jgi:hypothetical protein
MQREADAATPKPQPAAAPAPKDATATAAPNAAASVTSRAAQEPAGIQPLKLELDYAGRQAAMFDHLADL